MKLILALLLSCCSLFSFAQHGSHEMEVMMKMGSLRAALLAKDSMALSDLLSPDVTYGHSNGLIQTKSQLIHSLMTGEQDYKTISPSDMHIRVYDNTAVVNIDVAIKMLYQSKPLDMSMHVVLVWVNKMNKWQLVARQSVKY